MWPNPQVSAGSLEFVTFTEEILNGKLHFCALIRVLQKKLKNATIERIYSEPYYGLSQKSRVEHIVNIPLKNLSR